MASVLIIEDDSTFAQIIEGFLTKNNFEVTTVSNVAKALKLIAHEDFQLLLIDYRLPDGTGIDVLNHRRETGLTVPAIIMTSFNDVRTAVKAIQLGAADYITKPINPDELLMIISNALQKRKSPKLLRATILLEEKVR